MGVVGHLDAQKLPRAGVPCLRQVADGEGALDERDLELEAQDDVQRVGRLVGLHADQRRPHRVDRTQELVEGDRAQGLGEARLRPRQPVAPERLASADEVLPQAALGLVDSGRDARADHRARERRVDLALVEPVAHLVERAEDAGERVLREARRDSHVGRRDRSEERMDGLVQAPVLVVEPERAQHLQRERALLGGRKRRGERLDQRHQPLAQAAEDRADLGGGHLRLVAVEQGVIGVLGLREARRVAPAQLDVSLQVRGECREVGLGAGPLPRGCALCRGSREVGCELGGHAHRTVTVAAHDAGDRRVLLARGLEQLAERLVGQQLVGDALDRGHRLAALLCPARGHLRLLVPRHELCGVIDVGELGERRAQVT